jgi:hypothetical protein
MHTMFESWRCIVTDMGILAAHAQFQPLIQGTLHCVWQHTITWQNKGDEELSRKHDNPTIIRADPKRKTWQHCSHQKAKKDMYMY